MTRDRSNFLKIHDLDYFTLLDPALVRVCSHPPLPIPIHRLFDTHNANCTPSTASMLHSFIDHAPHVTLLLIISAVLGPECSNIDVISGLTADEVIAHRRESLLIIGPFADDCSFAKAMISIC